MIVPFQFEIKQSKCAYLPVICTRVSEFIIFNSVYLIVALDLIAVVEFEVIRLMDAAVASVAPSFRCCRYLKPTVSQPYLRKVRRKRTDFFFSSSSFS